MCCKNTATGNIQIYLCTKQSIGNNHICNPQKMENSLSGKIWFIEFTSFLFLQTFYSVVIIWNSLNLLFNEEIQMSLSWTYSCESISPSSHIRNSQYFLFDLLIISDRGGDSLGWWRGRRRLGHSGRAFSHHQDSKAGQVSGQKTKQILSILYIFSVNIYKMIVVINCSLENSVCSNF